MVISICILVVAVWGVFRTLEYGLLTPTVTTSSTRTQPLLRCLGTIAYGVAYVFSLLRAPLGLLPYLIKLWLQLGLKVQYEARKTTYAREIINMISEIGNLVITWMAIQWLVGSLRLQWWVILCYLPCWAEYIRILAERVPILFSAFWQILPHRRFAYWLQQRFSGRLLRRYCYYYQLSDNDRATFVLQVLKQKTANDSEVAKRLAYVHAFQIISQKQSLRGGLVRDVAQGKIFIHAIWTNDPWVLIGMALRRSPWPFDPRYLQRPFYYMSGANRVTSLFVLQHARYSLPYALFQFGHEIRVARLHCFYVLLRRLGADVERKVWADGTFQNDQWIFWLKQRLHIPRVVQ